MGLLKGLGKRFNTEIDVSIERTRETGHNHDEFLMRTLSSAVEQAADNIFMTDRTGRIEYVNPAFERLTGYRKEEVIGQTPRLLKSAAHDERLYRTMWQTITSGKAYRTELINKKKNGDLYHEEKAITPIHDDQGKIVHFVSTGKDITARKRAEISLRDSEVKFRTLAESTASGIFIYYDDKAAYVSPAGEALTGYSQAELAAMECWEFVHPDSRDLVVERRRARERGEAVPSRYELKILTKHGETRWIDVSVGAAQFDGRPATLVTMFDVSARVKAQQALHTSEEQLRQSQKLEAIGKLAGGIAHDFNNLLTAIIGSAELIQTDADLRDGEALCAMVEEIKQAGQRAAGLTHQLLAFSRRQMLRPTVLDLNALVVDNTKMLRRLIGEDIELGTLLDPALGQIAADKGQLEQVIMNLVINARDAMPRGGTLVLKTANVELDDALAQTYRSISPGRHVLLEVRDTGCGMDATTASKIFEPFFTTKELGKGTGLGLSTVYGIVKQSGGQIWVDSTPGRGTMFQIYLPRVDRTVDVLETTREPAPVLGGSEIVLLVEDEDGVRGLARRILQRRGYTVLEARSGREALLAADSHPHPLALRHGLRVLRQVSKMTLKTRVTILSATADEFSVLEALKNGARAYVLKSSQANDLTKAIREAVASRFVSARKLRLHNQTELIRYAIREGILPFET